MQSGKNGKKLHLIRWMILLLLAGTGAAAPVAWQVWQLWRTPYRGYLEAQRLVRIPPGCSASQVAVLLEQAGVIPEARLLTWTLRLEGGDQRLKHGNYRFSGSLTIRQVAALLVAGRTATVRVTIPEGWTCSKVFGLLEENGLGTRSAYLALWREPARLRQASPEADSLEGYLFPDTYQFDPDAGASQVVDALLARFRQKAKPLLDGSRPAIPLSFHQLVTLASLVEKETGAAGERPLVASVFYNRLKRDMLLQCDPTVIYAEWLRKGYWDGEINRSDLDFDSSYNTYLRTGLPPGPICNPGAAAIRAVAFPVDTPYLFFVSANNGTHIFSSRLEDHARAVSRYQRRP